MENRFRLRKVAEMLGVAAHRIDYAERHHQIPVERQHRYAHHWYTWEEIMAIAEWLGVPIPTRTKET